MSEGMPERRSREARGSDHVIEQWLGERRKLSWQTLEDLVSLARSHGGKLVDVTARGGAREPEDWCGTMWFKPWPPPKAADLLEDLIGRGYVLEVFPLGIPHLDAARIIVRNQARS